jgi:hypothetical protein
MISVRFGVLAALLAFHPFARAQSLGANAVPAPSGLEQKQSHHRAGVDTGRSDRVAILLLLG